MGAETPFVFAGTVLTVQALRDVAGRDVETRDRRTSKCGIIQI